MNFRRPIALLHVRGRLATVIEYYISVHFDSIPSIPFLGACLIWGFAAKIKLEPITMQPHPADTTIVPWPCCFSPFLVNRWALMLPLLTQLL